MKTVGWIIFGILCISIGAYPFLYFIHDMSGNFLSMKPDYLKNNAIWHTAFYLHITFGGLALLTGWSQFSSWIRKKYLKLHRILGSVYVYSVIISGLCAVGIGVFASHGIFTALGFEFMAVFWLASTIISFLAIKKRELWKHEKFMIYSYALCFGAVTLRIILPLLITITQDFVISYQMVAWLCWVPNLLVAYWIIQRKSSVLAS